MGHRHPRKIARKDVLTRPGATPATRRIVRSSKIPPLVTPTSFDICSLISSEPHPIGPLPGLDAKTLPDPVSVEALRTALAEAEERNARSISAPPKGVPSKVGSAPAAPPVVKSTPTPKKGSRWVTYSLALGGAILMATLRLAVEPLPGTMMGSSPPPETAPAVATMPAAAPDLSPAPETAPIVTAPVVVAAVKEKPAAFLVHRPVAVAPSAPVVAAPAAPAPVQNIDDSSTRAGKELAAALVPRAATTAPAAHVAPKAAKEEDPELAAAARLQKLAAQQVGASLGK
jgi:hypothetical protein